MLSSLLLVSMLAPQGPNAPVVINEFSYDDSSTDDHEFVELYNATNRPIDIGDWVLDSEDPVGANTAYTIPTGTTLNPGDYYVMGSGNVPNVDQIVGATNLWENSQESLTLRDPNGRIVDTLVYEANKGLWGNTSVVEGEGIWANMTSIAGRETSWSRVVDGRDTGNNGDDFALVPWTPGASNNRINPAYQDNFDSGTVGNAVGNWAGSFQDAITVDPTVADAFNPNAIVASPQGGNAAVFWDQSGGGNTVASLSAPGLDKRLECFVYLDATAEAAGETETFSVGFGTVGTFYNTPDPSGALGFSANGLTGISWTYQTLDSGGVLYLVDANDGGWGGSAMSPATILATIPIAAGTNDGWQRILLEVSGNTLTARFGGNYGQADGQLFTATITPTVSGLFVGYREFVTDNSTARPPTLDLVDYMSCPAAGVQYFGTPTPISSGTPMIDVSSAPKLGGSATIDGSNFVANGNAFVLLGLDRAAPFDLGAAGGIAGSFLYVDILTAPATPTSGSGNVSFPLGIPATMSLCGSQLVVQLGQFDLSLPNTIPLGLTIAARLTLGN